MKLFHLNLLSIVLLISLLAVFLLVPSFLIQAVWNANCASNLEQDLTIALWQAALLWGAFLTMLYMLGVFQFKLNFKSLDSIDIDSINDPELRAEVERLRLQAKKSEEQKSSKKNSDDSTN